MIADDAKPVVSVCIANYRGEAILAECVDSVLAQRAAPSFEVIVHDDASDDASLEILDRYPQVRVMRSAENVGFCISNNRMAEAAAGEFILLLNNDARLFEDALAALRRASAALGDDSILSLPQYDADSGELIDRGGLLDYFASPVPVEAVDRGELGMVMGACLWIPRRLWQRIGGFPPWFVTNAEDVYLCCYGRMLGATVRVPDESGYRHLVGHTLGGGKSDASGLTLSSRRRHYSERNRLLIQWAFYPAWMVPLTTVATILTLLLEALLLAAVNRRIGFVRYVYVDSLLGAWRAREHAAGVRRALAETRRIGYRQFFRPFRLLPQKLRLLAARGVPRVR